jgi:O-acetylhomoserine (thiol)-lyase
MKDDKLHIETELIHGAYSPDGGTGATALPIYQSTSFAYDSAEEISEVFGGRSAGFVYSRIGNPTVHQLECRLAILEGGAAALACASGMAAISSTALTLAGSGDQIVSGNSIFGGTYSLFDRTLRRYGIDTRFVESTDADAYRQAITDQTKLIFVETIGNPKMDVPNIAAIAEVAHAAGVALVVDNTVTTPVLVRPKDLGADIVVHSTSKYINGHGTAIGGAIVDCQTFDWANDRYANLKEFHARAGAFAFMAALRTEVFRDIGACFSPFNAFLMASGLESLGVRMERHCASAMVVAETLAADPRVEHVAYPGLTDHPGHQIALDQFGGRYGGLMAIRLGTQERCFKFINELKLAQNLANIGDAKTLVIHPASTLCRDSGDAERAAMGVTDDLVRLSIGLEHVDDILADIDRSLKALE